MTHATSDDQPPMPIPSGPFFANWGPRDDLILKEHRPPVMRVLGTRYSSEGPIGIAWLAGSIPSRKGPAQVWRLEVRKVELKGR